MVSEQLIRTASQELNELLGCDPPLQVDDDLNLLIPELKKAIGLLLPTDHVSKETKLVINDLSENPNKIKKAKATPIVEEPEETPEKEDTPPSLAQEIVDAERLRDLKDIATENDEFKSIRGKLSSYKTIDDLRIAMLEMIADTPEDEKEETLGEEPGKTYVVPDVEEQKAKNVKKALKKIEKKFAPKKERLISKTVYFEKSNLNPSIVLGSKVSFTTAPNSKIAPGKALIGTVEKIKNDPTKTPHEVVYITTPEGNFYKLTKNVTLSGKKK